MTIDSRYLSTAAVLALCIGTWSVASRATSSTSLPVATPLATPLATSVPAYQTRSPTATAARSSAMPFRSSSFPVAPYRHVRTEVAPTGWLLGSAVAAVVLTLVPVWLLVRVRRATVTRPSCDTYLAMAAVTGSWPYQSSRPTLVMRSSETPAEGERSIDPDELSTTMVDAVSETVAKYSNTEGYTLPTPALERVRGALNDLKKGGAYELKDFAATILDVVRSEVERLGTSPADWENVGVQVENIVTVGVLRFTGKDHYEPGDVSREAARRVRALVDNAAGLSRYVKQTVADYTGRDHYELGDLSLALDKRVKDSVAKMLEKDSYEVGDLSRVIDKLVKHEVETLTGKPYEFGDLSKAAAKSLQGTIASFTGRAEYRPGDLTREAGRRLSERLKSVTGKEDYQFGDITRSVIGRLFNKE